MKNMKFWNKNSKTSSSPSSPSSSPKNPSASPSPSPSRGGPPSSPARVFSALFSRRSSHEPRLTRQKKIRHLSGIQVGEFSFDEGSGSARSDSNSNHHRRGRSAYSTPVSRSPSSLEDLLVPHSARSSSSPVLLPRPLPVPESASTSQRIPELQLSNRFQQQLAAGCPLPSPKDAAGYRVWDKEGKDGTTDFIHHGEQRGERNRAAKRRIPILQSISKSFEHVDSPSSGCGSRSSRGKHAKEDMNGGSKQSFRLSVPAKSAPSSGLSSPIISPRGQSSREFFSPPYFSPQLHPISASVDYSTDFLAGFHAPVETFPGSPDYHCATPYSPTVRSPGLRSRNPSAPSSPLHPKLFPENSSPWPDTKGNVNGHPLPLPPGPMPPQSPTHPVTQKVEVSSMATQWKKGTLIGRGTFGSVYKATNRNNGATCAMKEVDLIPDDPKSTECIKQLQQEIKFLSQLKHPNIVEYYGSEIVEDKFYIYLEFVSPGSIQNYLSDRVGAITESVVRSFTRHILEGLAYLHNQDVMHRDIKGANLLVDTHGVVKLADFGMAKHLGEVKGQLSMKGTPYWMAPEVLQASMNKDLGYNLAVDIWSLGCTVIEMFTGKHPWNGLESAAAMFKVLHASPDIPETLSNEGKDFLRCCFQRNPADRPTANELLKHPFVAPFNELRSSFAGMKLSDGSHCSKINATTKNDSSIKSKHIYNWETTHLHLSEATDCTGNNTSPRSTLETVPSYSPPHLSKEVISFPSPSRLPNGSPRTSLDLPFLLATTRIPSSPPRLSHDAQFLPGPSNFRNGFHGVVASPTPFAFSSKPQGREVPHLF